MHVSLVFVQPSADLKDDVCICKAKVPSEASCQISVKSSVHKLLEAKKRKKKTQCSKFSILNIAPKSNCFSATSQAVAARAKVCRNASLVCQSRKRTLLNRKNRNSSSGIVRTGFGKDILGYTPSPSLTHWFMLCTAALTKTAPSSWNPWGGASRCLRLRLTAAHPVGILDGGVETPLLRYGEFGGWIAFSLTDVPWASPEYHPAGQAKTVGE